MKIHFHKWSTWHKPFSSTIWEEFGRFGKHRQIRVVKQSRICKKCGFIDTRIIRDGVIEEEHEPVS